MKDFFSSGDVDGLPFNRRVGKANEWMDGQEGRRKKGRMVGGE